MDYLTVAFAKGRLGEQSAELFNKIGIGHCLDLKSRKLVFIDEENKIKFMLLKNSDVVTYVDNGVADIGIVGMDMLKESRSDVYQLYNLPFGYCNMSIAGMKGAEVDRNKSILRVATKFTNSAKEYFESRGQKIEIIKLNGSVELAPVLGLSDVIVDIVETGNTLRANGLEVMEEMFEINPLIIANRIGYKFKMKQIDGIIEKIRNLEEA
ncbi:ATP phosphoribosyltransferase [Dethiosulfatibacter aminovorans DSM 17477]|uniref:ATP phosphoribosyltransferase n=1 Tax=Dethiosulfatibacter aminovorans DSM 17477 TaxID=1121476 RepID=A0A1M6H483_9FIRM|nr:ATP phosphoribosyltransferase [Dethiosulfatibacter aminovorans]SHJ16956.1 ATP phosphoribosyltransferase [Dethiosulfatibacter aminovorans DSM 17477]